uniref:Putative secreted protein n=1 Tax=Amblyomma triste TaxID=251400 RepID=A0A023G1L9_AMBTT
MLLSSTPWRGAAGCLWFLIVASLVLEQQRCLCDEGGPEKGIIVFTTTSTGRTLAADAEREPGFWESFRTYVLGDYNGTRHDWHRRFFNRYVPLFGVITLSLVAVALCLSYWCQDRNSPETESSRAHLEEMRRMQCGERVPMYTMPPPPINTFTHADYAAHDYYRVPPPQYNYATFEARVPANGPHPSAPPPAYHQR